MYGQMNKQGYEGTHERNWNLLFNYGNGRYYVKQNEGMFNQAFMNGNRNTSDDVLQLETSTMPVPSYDIAFRSEINLGEDICIACRS